MTIRNYSDYLEHLSLHGDKTALIEARTGRQLGYGELVDLSRRLVACLEDLGCRKGDRLMLFGLPGLDWVPIFFAGQLAGIVVVPIDTRASAELVGMVIESTAPVLLIEGPGTDLKTELPKLKSGDLIKRARKRGEPKTPRRVAADSVGQILLTSGTWSQPKGVTLKQSNLLHNMAGAEQIHRVEPGEVLLSILPLAHAYEQMCGLHLPLKAGGTVVYLDEIQAEKIKAAVKRYDVSLIVAVPRILELFKAGIIGRIPEEKQPKILLINRLLRFAPTKLRRRVFKAVHQGLGPSLRTLVVGGAPLAPATDRFFQGLGYKTLIGYGLSETSPIISIMTKQYRRRKGEVGRILPNLEAKTNDQGELLVRGPSVFAGYWPQRRNRAAWFNTGDLARLAGRRLFLGGRRKDMFVFASGDKAMAEEVEAIVDNAENVEESIALADYDDDRTAVGIHVVYRAEQAVSEPAVKRSLANYLPPSAKILSLRNIYPENLERTHTLKLARQRNYERFVE